MGKRLKVFAVVGIFLGALLCGISPGFADEELEGIKNEMRAMSETIQQLQQTIGQMQGVIDRHESQASRAVATPVGASSSDVEELRAELETFKGIVDKFPKISGYFDMEWYNDDQGSSPNEFKQHHLSLFLDKRIEKWHFFSELEYEYAYEYVGPTTIGTTTNGVTGSGEAKVETTWVEYNHSDLFNLRAGKVLLPQYTTVNHYPSLVLSTTRPLMVKRVFPFDTTGVMAYGTHYLDNEWGGDYNLFVGNGEAADRSKDDANDDKVWGGKLTAHIPLFFDQFDLGASTYMGENASDKHEWMWGAETHIALGDFEFLSEVAHNNNDGQFGYYVQPSYHFLPKWTGFYRWDSRDDDNKVDNANDSLRHTMGFVYRPLPAISLKGEVYRDLPDNRTREVVNGFGSSVVIFF